MFFQRKINKFIKSSNYMNIRW